MVAGGHGARAQGFGRKFVGWMRSSWLMDRLLQGALRALTFVAPKKLLISRTRPSLNLIGGETIPTAGGGGSMGSSRGNGGSSLARRKNSS